MSGRNVQSVRRRHRPWRLVSANHPRSSPGRLRLRRRQQDDFQMARPNLQNMHSGEFSPSLRTFKIVFASGARQR